MLDQLVACSVERSTISMTQAYRNCSAEIMLGDSSFHRVRACITKSYMPWVSGECRATVVWYRLYRACEAGDRSARRDLCGGRGAILVPTATDGLPRMKWRY